MNLSFKQLIILIIVGFLLFGDISFIKNNFNFLLKNIKDKLKYNDKIKNRKKGT
jgi:hypothetical protein